ncbi:PREDICTED: uncharacterized protein LOC105127384 [Populus euphratica]|uniref:Uncharacterized protein LOC105127384 n=1 Tax=Populus euphratica TaxID=75702 RepID=A0AAJ6XQ69_POPEU|nr:PREDICTED: uncharacterized protein LOC105127384 [Populus euphratica]
MELTRGPAIDSRQSLTDLTGYACGSWFLLWCLLGGLFTFIFLSAQLFCSPASGCSFSLVLFYLLVVCCCSRFRESLLIDALGGSLLGTFLSEMAGLKFQLSFIIKQKISLQNIFSLSLLHGIIECPT